jgi:DNA-binding NarL/FixJ family response regulator
VTVELQAEPTLGEVIAVGRAVLHGLSRQQARVLPLMACGLTNRAIGRHLGVSRDTAAMHIGVVLRKLHARDRAHAVSIAYQLGILTVNGGVS